MCQSKVIINQASVTRLAETPEALVLYVKEVVGDVDVELTTSPVLSFVQRRKRKPEAGVAFSVIEVEFVDEVIVAGNTLVLLVA